MNPSRRYFISPSFPADWRAEEFINHATILLDTVAYLCESSLAMPMYADAFNTLQQRLVHACDRVRKIRVRMAELASAYNEYGDLKKQLDTYTKQINSIKGVFGPAFVDVMRNDSSDSIGETSEISPNWKQAREAMPLWLAIREYLAAVGEAKVGEVDTFLNELQFPNVRRQSIESALRRHPETFHVRKEKHDKYVSLRGSS